MTFGERLKRIRKQRGLTQKGLGMRLGVSSSMVAQYENNLRNPKYGTIEKIAKVLECDTSELLTAQMIIDHVIERLDEIPAGTKAEVVTITSDMLPLSFPTVEDRISYYFSRLNEEGKRVAADRVQELTEIPKYQLKEAPNAPQDNP